MQNKTQLGFNLTIAAIAFGFIADRLLKETPWGFNVTITTLLLVALVFGFSRWHRIVFTGAGRWFAIPAILFSIVYILRDAETLNFLNFCAVLLCLALMAYRMRIGRWRVASVVDYALGLVVSAVSAAIGAVILLVRVIRWREFASPERNTLFSRVLIGLIFAVPLLIVFGGLFVAADANFERLVREIFDFNRGDIFRRIILTAFWSWLAAGFLWLIFFADFSRSTFVATTESKTKGILGIVEVGVVLGLLNALFAAFVATQLRYFFGGAALVLDVNDTSNNFTFAEYARRGFFELVNVAALVLIVLLVANRITRTEKRKDILVFRGLTILLICLQFVITASALHRMWIYTRVFGLTELRIYTTAFMLWLVAVFIWFMWTTLRGHGDRFAFGAIVSGLCALLMLNAFDPIGTIVRTNVTRISNNAIVADDFVRAERLDASYLARLGRDNADAVIPLIQAMSQLRDKDRCVVAAGLTLRLTNPLQQSDVWTDFRTWNASRAQAAQWLEPNAEFLKRTECPN
jgi:hypothetical protein